MTNPLKGEVALEAGGTSYTLVLDIEALIAVEDKFDKSITQLASILLRTQRLGILRAMLHAALKARHPAVTEKMAGEILRAAGVPDVLEAIAEALRRAYDDGGEAAASPADPPQTGAAEPTGAAS